MPTSMLICRIEEEKVTMKKFIAIFVLTMAVSMGYAQDTRERFSPERFQAEMEQFVVREANLTQQEAARFLPIFSEMNAKLRQIYHQQRQLARSKPTDDQSCMEAIKKNDQLDIELKQIQQTYHNKYLTVLPGVKAYQVMCAENRFHREMLKKWSRKHR